MVRQRIGLLIHMQQVAVLQMSCHIMKRHMMMVTEKLHMIQI